MGRYGETEPKMPRWTKKRSPRERVKRVQTLPVHPIEPLVVQQACRSTGSQLHHSLVRLLEPGCSQEAELRTQGHILPGPERRESTDVTDMPSTPPASRGLPELFVPDSPEETWALGEDSPRRQCKIPRTPPISTNLAELVVPDSPEETWASPPKLSQTPPISTKFEDLVVPESPEESDATKDPSSRPFKLRRTRLRNLHPELVSDRIKAGLESPFSESISKRSEKRTFEKAADSRNSDRSHHLPILAAEKISRQFAPIGANEGLGQASPLSCTARGSGSPRVTDGLPTLSELGLSTPGGKPPVVPSMAMNKVDLDLRDNELNSCSQSQGAVHQNGYLGDTMPLYVQDTEDQAPITPFSTLSGLRAVSSVALEEPKALLLDCPVKKEGTRVKAGARSGKGLQRDIPSPIRSNAGDPAPTTPFPTASEKPISISFRPLKKARALLRLDELDTSDNTAAETEAGYEKNASRAVPTSEIGTDDVVPASFSVATSGKPVLLSSTESKKSSEFADNILQGPGVCYEFAGAGYQHKLHTTVQSSEFSSSQNERPMNSFSMGTRRAVSASGDMQTTASAPHNGEILLKSPGIGNGNAVPASTDVQTSTVIASNGEFPIKSFVPGRGKSVSATALERVRELLRDEFEETATVALFSGPSHLGNLDIDAKPLKFSSTEDAAPAHSSTVAMGERGAQRSSSNIVGCAVPITRFVTGSGKSVAAVSSQAVETVKSLLEDQYAETETIGKVPRAGYQRTLLHGEFGGPEGCNELAGTGYRENLHRDALTSKVTEYMPPGKSLMAGEVAGEESFDAFRRVPSPVIDYADPIISFVTGTGKSVERVSSNSLERAKKLLGDQFEETETMAQAPQAGDQRTALGREFEGTELSGTGYQENVPRDVRTSKVTNIKGVTPIDISMEGLNASSYVTSPAIGYKIPITSFVTGSGKSVAAVSAKALERVKKLLGDQFEEAENMAKVSQARDQRAPSPCAWDPPMSASTVAVTNAPSLSGIPARDDYVTGAGITFNSLSVANGRPISVASLASGKGSVHLRNDEGDDDHPTSRRNSDFGSQIPPLSDTSTENGMLESSSNFTLKRAGTLLGDRVMDDGNSGRVILAAFLTASGKPISVTSLGMKKALLRDNEMGSDDHPLPRCNGECPPAKSARELAVSVPSTTPKKGKPVWEGDEKENHGEFESLQHRHVLRNSELTINRSRRPLSEIQAGCSILRTSDKGERFSPASGKMGASDSSQRKEEKELSEGNRPYRTRSGRTITISNEAIVAAKIRLGAGVREGHGSQAAEKTEDLEGKSAITSGSGRAVTISREAMEKATTIIADGIKTASLREPAGRLSAERAITEFCSPTPVFQTASGRTVAVSSEAMSRAKDLLAPKVTVQSPSHDRGLNVQCVLPKEIRSPQSENVCDAVIARRVGPCATITPHPPQRHRDEEFEHPVLVTSNSTTQEFHNSESCPSRAVPPSTAGQNQWGDVRAFKPPRIRDRRQPDDIVTSEGELLTLISGPRGSGIQRSPSSLAFGTHEYHRLQPSRLAYLQDRVGPGGRKLRRYIGRPPASQDLPPSIEARSMTADAAEYYQFQHVTQDGRWESVGSTEIRELLLRQGADTLYASKEWVANHYKWIIWKLASLERKYAQKSSRKPVTLDTVLNELKYRYDTELSGFRSAIRRITEGDSSASRTIVLCVSAIRHNGDKGALHEPSGKMSSSDAAKIEVTDGWYRVSAVLDAPLTEKLRTGKLKVGQKIQVSGATLCGCSDSKSPLEAFQDSFLTLHMNGTYRAHQNQRLGFCRVSCLPLAFRIIKPDGGLVPKTYVGVTRVYPMLFKEISAEGVSIVRAARAEEIASNQFEQRRTKAVEEAILKLETSSNTLQSQDEKDEGCRLFDAIERSAEPDVLLADLTPVQLKAFAAYQTKRETSRQAATEDAVKEALQDAGLYTRNVKRFLKVRVTGLRNKSDRNVDVGQQTKEGTITIWDVNDEQNIVEGSVYCVSRLRPCSWGSSGNEDHLQLQSYRSTSWRLVPEAIYAKHFSFPFTCRAPTRLSELDEKYVNREFDVAAMVLQVGEPLQSGSRQNQWVFVTDGSTALNSPRDTWVEIQILAIKVNLPSLAFAPVEPSLVGSVVGFCNLIQQPKDQIRHLWVAEASELSFFSSNFISKSMTHLRGPAGCVSKWAASSRWETDSLRHLVQGLLWEGSQ